MGRAVSFVDKSVSGGVGEGREVRRESSSLEHNQAVFEGSSIQLAWKTNGAYRCNETIRTMHTLQLLPFFTNSRSRLLYFKNMTRQKYAPYAKQST